MSPTALLALLLTVTLAASAVAWLASARRVAAPVSAVLLAVTTGTAAAAPAGEALDRPVATLVAVLTGAVAVLGGGPVTAWVFGWVDRREPPAHGHDLEAAGTVLRGGAWIGALERAAVFVSVATAQPEGLAIALALKGLGRYPELRSGASAGTAERFIIGTFTSVLWAVACAGVLLLAL